MTRGRRHRNHLRRPSVGLRIRQMRR
jgi:hypothetical protein